MGWARGLEPPTPRTTTWCSNQLSYAHHRRLAGMKHSGAGPLRRTSLLCGAGAARRGIVTAGYGAGLRPVRTRVPCGDLPGGERVRAGRWHEHRVTVIAQFLDALGDVGQGPVPATLGRAGEIRPRVPSPGELLDAGHVHHPVMQERVQF